MGIYELYGLPYEDGREGYLGDSEIYPKRRILRGRSPVSRPYTPKEVTIMPVRGRVSRTELQTTQQYIAKQISESRVKRGSTGFVNEVGQKVRNAGFSIAAATASTALSPLFPPVGQIVVSVAMDAAVTKIQENLKPPDPGLQDNTILKTVEPNQGKVLEESTVRETLKRVVLPGNFAHASNGLQPTVKRVADEEINIKFPRHGILRRRGILSVTSDRNTINTIYKGFLK